MRKNKALKNSVKKAGYKEPLRELLPYGMLATKKWLTMQGFSTHALDNAVKTETLLLLASGVYSQYTRNLRWEGIVASLQRMDDSPVPSVHVGGLTALYLSGLSQYLSMGKQVVHLYSQNKLPSWLARLSLSTIYESHSVKALWSESVMKSEKFIKAYEWESGLPPIYYSCPEKAILEVLASTPGTVTIEHANELMQGLVNLSPRKLDALLDACCNIKVKRLFFWLAKRQNYSWFKKLKSDKYDLGSGKRVIVKGGILDKDYLITVPRHMADINEL
ncbi:type IV toxin-antitoxin system AbiEi family antitoxin [Pleionea mediterranea]|uniref:Transcriptional regulator with AbiEi antitoxin domain of type IV toxin-antitoxin system n=1 Tax=Pleionea mediterranea TaxID=523701 RepID=A0A316FZT8_9GAMM|nr:type IV toxin-antitoxin system AbiEi family antitoxin [Pleionea mediterranea]PWK53913.1 transcriptional regulator with AbiEi antitoxin domain of type IV toxin-antitoxin system [Pleionea mediterranea]